MMEQDFPNLVQFFGGTFNQDWCLDDPTPFLAIKRFVAENSPEFVCDVIAELDQFRSLPLTDSEMRSILYEKFNCYYIPNDGDRLREWLAETRLALSGEN